MSVFKPRTIACPRCGDKRRRVVALSINAPRRPDVRRAILEGRFQRYVCESCGGSFTVDGPLFYVDFERHQFFGVFPSAWEGAWRAVEAEVAESFRQGVAEHAPEFVRAQAPEFTVRAIFGLAALREKLLCLEAGIEDDALEALKLDLMRSGPRFHPSARPRLSELDSERLHFEVPEGGLEVPRGQLDLLASDPAWRSTREQLCAGVFIDVGRLLLSGDEPRPTRTS
jgi:hypothetical protein